MFDWDKDQLGSDKCIVDLLTCYGCMYVMLIFGFMHLCLEYIILLAFLEDSTKNRALETRKLVHIVLRGEGRLPKSYQYFHSIKCPLWCIFFDRAHQSNSSKKKFSTW